MLPRLLSERDAPARFSQTLVRGSVAEWVVL